MTHSSNKILNKHQSHLILLGFSIVNIVPIVVFLGMALGGITTHWVILVVDALVTMTTCWPALMLTIIGGLWAFNKPGLCLYNLGKDEPSGSTFIKLWVLLISFVLFCVLFKAYCISLHIALALIITVLTVVMHLLLHVCAAMEDKTSSFKEVNFP
jgi:hypothetical protein